jgi:hypothetical protein
MRVAGLTVILAATLAVAMVGALLDRPRVVVGAAAATVVMELVIRFRSLRTAESLATFGAGLPIRAALGGIAVTYLAARGTVRAVAVGTVVAVIVIVVATIGFVSLRRLAVELTRRPLRTRGLDLTVVEPRSPGVLTQPPGLGVVATLLIAIGLQVDWHSRSASGAAVCLALATVAAAIPVVALASSCARMVRGGMRQRLVEAANAAVAELRPEVVLYFAATSEELYQVRQWLEPVRRLDRPALVVLRSHEAFEQLGDIGLPVAVTPYNGTLANLALPDRFAVLFVTHTGNNLSMIRRPEARTAFVGHGDSDKPDSINPFARVYDEVWVAGPLGRRRYVEARVGVRDEVIVEIGRPQVQVPTAPPPSPPVVVYAPTWEGWGDDPHHSSLAQVGPALVELLAGWDGVRVRYRPHPLTGNRSRELRQAHDDIIELIEDGRPVELVPGDEELDVTLAGASALIADVSSVVSEWLAFDRPYAVVDTRGLGADRFRARFPSTAGGFILDADLSDLTAFVKAAAGGPDPTAGTRRALVRDALGDPATSQQRFAAAVDGLLAR